MKSSSLHRLRCSRQIHRSKLRTVSDSPSPSTFKKKEEQKERVRELEIENEVPKVQLIKTCGIDAPITTYDCWKGKRLYHVQLPELCKPSLKAVNYFKDQDIHRPTHMVAVSDSKLCFLWIFMFRLFCAEVFVPPGPDDPVPELLEVRHFHIADPEGVTINNFLAVDASLGQMAKVSKLFDLRREATICPVGNNSMDLRKQGRSRSSQRRRIPSLRCSMKLTGDYP